MIKKLHLSLSTSILIALVAGVGCGIFFGEYCAHLKIVGDAFIMLLQMSILPYITISLIAGIGSLTFIDAKLFARKAGLLLLLFWAIAFIIILAMPLSFPEWETAAFFSSSIVEPEKQVNFLELYIPANPFYSLANSIVPAVVLFSIAVGVGLIGLKNKENLIQNISILSQALMRIALFIVKLTPIGVFAISASAAGAMTIGEFGRLQVYFITYIVATILLAFWVLPILIKIVLPVKYKDIVGISRDALITAFATNNLFIVLPVLSKNCKTLFEKYNLKTDKSTAIVDTILPISFNFPNMGKLLVLLFVLFAAWFYGIPVPVTDYPNFMLSGLFSFFGSVDLALPFMLDTMQIPSDAFQLYVATGIIIGRFTTLLAVMHLFTFTVIATYAITGNINLQWKKVLAYATITVGITVGTVLGTRIFLSHSVKNLYNKDQVIAGMQFLHNPQPAIVHKTVIPAPLSDGAGQSTLQRIHRRGVIRVGYRPDFLPFSYFNQNGDLVGFDIEMAHRLARELHVNLEFIPFELDTMASQLNDNDFDIIMSGIAITTDRLEQMSFPAATLDVTLALVVKDYRRNDFVSIEKIRKLGPLKFGIIGARRYFVAKTEEVLPSVELVKVKSFREFFENNQDNLDAMLTGAELGSAWTLLYPEYQVVAPKPHVLEQPISYPVVKGDQEMTDFMSQWINLKKKDRTIKKLYDHWILGQGTVKKEPRWSILRNVLHWVD